MSQPLEALAKGNAVRIARADDKRAVAAGRKKFSDLVYGEHWARASVVELLMLMPRAEWMRAVERLQARGVPLVAEVGQLTARQREQVRQALTYTPKNVRTLRRRMHQ